MTKIVKSNWASDGDNIRLSMPLAKVDKENRLVSGYATLDNVDSQGDVVLAEASAKAFARARGNLREMHQSIAVGKIVDFREDEFYNSEDGKFYRGIFVTAYVSKGAQDTWEKVLDGTLTGFSIGGSIIDAESQFVKDAGENGETVRFIKDYDLVELSLVDNPANQLANVESISKVFSINTDSNGSVTVKGMVVDTEIENVFYCKEHPTALKASKDSTAKCVECQKEMVNIGWFETGGDRAEKVRNVVTKFLGLDAAEDASGEGGVEMAKKDETTPAETVETETPKTDEVEETETDETAEAVEEVDETAGTEQPEEEVAEVEEVTDEEEVIAKKIDELKETVHSSLEKTRNETGEQVAALEKKIDEINESFTKKASELENRFSEFGEKLETAKSRLAQFEKSLETINSSEAFRKSADLEDRSGENNVQKSKTTWNGAFSIDNVLR